MRLAEFSQMIAEYLEKNGDIEKISAQDFHILVEMKEGSRFLVKLQNVPKSTARARRINE